MTPDSTTPAIRFDDVHVLFAGWRGSTVWALRGLSLVVPPGAVMGLLGPNGAGKTTSIACLLGLIQPQAGTIELWGREVDGALPSGGPACGVLLEDTRLPPFLSVRAALLLVCSLRGQRNPLQEVDRVVEICGVGDLMSRTVAALSKGQARKVGLAAALISDPPLLVLDEPSAGLDADARVQFEELVRSLRDGKRTLLIASHLLGDVESMCSHVAVIQGGRSVLFGEVAALLGDARRGQQSEVHVDASASAELTRLGIGFEPSRFPGLALLRYSVSEEELFILLASARIPPRRVEPRVSVLSVYLDTTRMEAA